MAKTAVDRPKLLNSSLAGQSERPIEAAEGLDVYDIIGNRFGPWLCEAFAEAGHGLTKQTYLHTQDPEETEPDITEWVFMARAS